MKIKANLTPILNCSFTKKMALESNQTIFACNTSNLVFVSTTCANVRIGVSFLLVPSQVLLGICLMSHPCGQVFSSCGHSFAASFPMSKTSFGASSPYSCSSVNFYLVARETYPLSCGLQDHITTCPRRVLQTVILSFRINNNHTSINVCVGERGIWLWKGACDINNLYMLAFSCHF